MAPKPISTSTIYGYLFCFICLASPFLNTTLCRLVSTILIIRLLMLVIQATVTSDQRRTFALGFLISALAYLSWVWQVDEFHPRRDRNAQLPTTSLLTSVSTTLTPSYSEPTSTREAVSRARAKENEAAFMILGQLLFASTFGIGGGLYANRLTKSTVRMTSDLRPH